ncbi:MAG: flagellar hook-basal body complex protein FliE [Gammaproteobacteria bacterium]|nr:MAG: flagellar hook-basal body complex protein FliE [Gammaproteobacteria bacterium]
MSEISVQQLLTQMRAMTEMAQGKVFQVDDSVQANKGVDFSSLLQQSVDKVNEIQTNAGNMTMAFESGDPNVTLPEVMVALQKANISFQAISQVRNKLISAYQDVMSMPI